MPHHRPPVSEEHQIVAVLDDFFAGARSVGEVGRLAVELLVEHCPECRKRLENARLSIEEAFTQCERRGRAIVADLERERTELPHLLASLIELGPTEAVVQVAGDPRCHTAAFVEHELEVAWAAFEQGATSVADEAWMLALVALRGLDVGRYGKPMVARLESELWLLEARAAILRGDLETSGQSLVAAAELMRLAGPPAELWDLELLATAELALAEGDMARARDVALAALGRQSREGSERWRLALERLLARIERLEGHPRAAGDRLLAALEGRKTLPGGLEWTVGREALSALLEAGAAEEAYAWFLTWWPRREGEGEMGAQAPGEARAEGVWRPGEEVGERELVLGLILRALGRREESRGLLEAVQGRSLRMGLGRDAMVATLAIVRLHVEAGDPKALKRELGKLEELAECPDVPAAPLRELVRFGMEVWRGSVGELQRVERIERSLLLDSSAASTETPHGPP